MFTQEKIEAKSFVLEYRGILSLAVNVNDKKANTYLILNGMERNTGKISILIKVFIVA